MNNSDFITYKKGAPKFAKEIQKFILGNKEFQRRQNQVAGLPKTRQICQALEEWEVERLRFCWNKNKEEMTLIQDLSLVKLPYLKLLNVRNNNIESIEKLSKIYMPRINKLLLFDNRITTCRQLKKGCWKQLDSIFLQNNYLSEVYEVAKLELGEFENINIESLNEDRQCCDIRWAAKMKQNKLTLDVKSNIKEERLEKNFGKKFNHLSFRWKI